MQKANTFCFSLKYLEIIKILSLVTQYILHLKLNSIALMKTVYILKNVNPNNLNRFTIWKYERTNFVKFIHCRVKV